MPKIARPRALLLYMVDRLEEQGSRPTYDTIVNMCAEIQSGGTHIYSYSGNPDDFFLQERILRDLQDCEGNLWLEKEGDCFLVSKKGKAHLAGMTPGAELEAKITVLLPKYKSQVCP
jgi:hypothetical protein